MTKRFDLFGAFLIVAALLAAGCSETGDREASPEVLNERRAAYRQACAASELAEIAGEDLLTLEQVAGNPSSDPLAALQRGAATAAVQYSRTYQGHADLREAAYAYLDSAANHSATPADSVRYHDRSNAFIVRLPVSGSVEENVFRSYQQKLVTLLQDGDHPCNWDLPF